MKINPFDPIYFKDMLIFKYKQKVMCLKTYEVQYIKDIINIFDLVGKKVKNVNSITETIHLHWFNKKRAVYFSLNFTIDENPPFMAEISQDLEDINVALFPSSPSLQYQDYYYAIFTGYNNFHATIDRNYLVLKDPDTGEKLLHVSFFEINLKNIEFIPNVFHLMNDFALKLGVNMDLLIFMDFQNKIYKISAILIINHKDEQTLDQVIHRVKNVDEFKLILNDSKFNKKVISSCFIRRNIDSEFTAEIKNKEDFIKTCFNDVLLGTVLEEVSPAVNAQVEPPVPVSPTPIAVLDVAAIDSNEKLQYIQSFPAKLNKFKIKDGDVDQFHSFLASNGIQGKFIDLDKHIFDSGRTVYMLVKGLNVELLGRVLQEQVVKREFQLFFIDEEEYFTFKKIFSSEYPGVFECGMLLHESD